MRIVVLTLAATTAILATPAMANEGRIEARGGIVWGGGSEEATAGVAAGYDWDLGDSTFVGVEASADKVLASGYDVSASTVGRFGIKPSTDTKMFIEGGYTFAQGEDTPLVGVGVEQKLGSSLYGRLGYRHNFSDFADADTVSVGLGVKF